MDEDIRPHDQQYFDQLINDVDNNDDLDAEMKQAMNESLNTYNDEFMITCEDNIIQNQIQHIIQQEINEKNNRKKQLEENLKPVFIRLTRIDENQKYTTMLKDYIHNDKKITIEQYEEIINFIKKPCLVNLITENILK